MISLIKRRMEINPEIFVNNVMLTNIRHHKLLKSFRISLNILVILGSFILVVISTLIISKLAWSGWPIWYYYFTSAMSALTTFTALIINLFVIEKKIYQTKIINQKILAELAFYLSAQGKYKSLSVQKKEYLLFNQVAIILKYEIAMKGDHNDFNKCN